MKRLAFITIILISLLFTGCSLPKIIVLEDPLSTEEHINLGVAYERNGEFDNALKEYKQAAAKVAVGYLYMGNVYIQKNEFADAEASYKKAIKKDERNSDAYNNLAWLYYLKNEELDTAESFALKAIELNPSKREIYQDTLDRIRERTASIKEGKEQRGLPPE